MLTLGLVVMNAPTTAADAATDGAKPIGADPIELPVAGPWNEIDDRVMGGISRGSASVDSSGHMVWTGRMTTDSNGGFVTTRAGFTALDLSAMHGITFRVRGDGRTYEGTRPLDTSSVRSLQFQLSGAEHVGEYRLDLARVSASGPKTK